MSKLLILGAGGHGRVVAETAMLTGNWRSIAFLDNNKSSNVMGIPVIGDFDSYNDLIGQYSDAFVALGNNSSRMIWLSKLEKAGYKVPTIVHPNSTISRYCQIEKGSVVMAGVVVNANSTISKGCILNTSCIIEHDNYISKGVHISPAVAISGTVTIGELSWLGVGARIANNLSIGSNVIVAAGATVIHDIPDNVMVAGVPAKFKKSLGDEY